MSGNLYSSLAEDLIAELSMSRSPRIGCDQFGTPDPIELQLLVDRLGATEDDVNLAILELLMNGLVEPHIVDGFDGIMPTGWLELVANPDA